MSLVNITALRELLDELDGSDGSGPTASGSRVSDLLYALCISTGEPDPDEAVARARHLVAAAGNARSPAAQTAGGPGPTDGQIDRLLAELSRRTDGLLHHRTLDEVVRLTPSLIPSCVTAGAVRWTDGGEFQLLAGLLPAQAELDRAQLAGAQGPLLDARARPGEPVAAAFGSFGTCPGLAAPGQRFGVRSGLAVMLPARAPDQHTAFSVYFDAPGPPDGTVRRLCTIQALRAELALENAALVGELAALLDQRGEIGRAVGIVMERHGLGSQAAFDLLGRTAHFLGSSVPAIAAQLVGGTG
ncbi:ANTAR domain-containing protein [Kitasatospora sp. NPDC006697]|uniref:ANTAR domain-containing protein n=1 Tax=Kitasatospora sp. NPDC006697 TaxID=3364020 RepID=UPI00367E0496